MTSSANQFSRLGYDIPFKAPTNLYGSVGKVVNSKEIKQFAVSIAILETIESDGLRRHSFEGVAAVKVSRAWIYEYIRKEKGDLIAYGADVFAGYMARITLTALPKTKQDLQAQLNDGVEFLFESVEKNRVIIKLYFRFRGTENLVGQVIKKYEKRWMQTATKTVHEVVGLPVDQSELLVELVLTVRLGFAHRIASASDPAQARLSADKIFAVIHSMMGESWG